MANRILNFDANAGAPLLPAARDAVVSSIDDAANASSIHSAGRCARNLLEVARDAVGSICRAGKDQVIFTSGATEAAALALSPCILDGRESRAVGAVYIGATEHPCVLAGGRLGDRIRFVPVSAEGVIDVQALERLLSAHDRSSGVPMLALMLANNETGTVQPVAQAARLLKDHDGYVFCDAVQAFGRVAVDIEALGCDFLTVSSHKIGGPQGAGALVLANETVRPLPIWTGGGQERGHRAGTENIAAIAGFGVAARHVGNHLQDVDRIRRLRNRVETGIGQISPDAGIAGDGAERLANTAMFVVPGLAAETAVIAFDLDGVAVSSGSACSSGKVAASHVLQAMGYSAELAGSGIRVSLPVDATDDDIDYFLTVWRSIDSRLRPDRAA